MMGRSCKIALSRESDLVSSEHVRGAGADIHFGVLKPTFSPPQTKHLSHVFTSETESHLLKNTRLLFLHQYATHTLTPHPPPRRRVAAAAAARAVSPAAAAAAVAVRLSSNNQHKGREKQTAFQNIPQANTVRGSVNTDGLVHKCLRPAELRIGKLLPLVFRATRC